MTSKDFTRLLAGKMQIPELREMQQELLTTDACAVRLAAPTGSGKTIAFAGYLLRRIAKPKGYVQGAVIVPSRELALQVSDVIRKLAYGMKTVTLYGGHAVADETKSLTPVPDIIVATPGRLLDHLNRRRIDLSATTTFIIDEYDKSLELGFESDMRRLRLAMTAVRHIVLTSATPISEPPSWLGANDFVDFDHSGSEASSKPAEVVEIKSPARDKAQTLIDTLLALQPQRAIVFVNHRESAERTYTLLRRGGIDTALYHGGLDQNDRENALTMLANGSARVLVATDLAARGLDIAGLDAVIHYHLPTSPEAWIHRNGRTSRNGADGTVYIMTSEAADSLPEYINTTRIWNPTAPASCTLTAAKATLHINAGRKEKISRADVVGFLMAHTNLRSDEIGPISLSDHQTLVAIPRDKSRETAVSVAPFRLKNKRVRITQMKL